jgi:hypothetical protein
MNVPEGARRMRRGGVFLLLSSLLAAYAGAWVSPDHSMNALLIVIPGALLWLAGWILEGFSS